ncbi:MAG TPA: nitroreductase family protein [Myxococcota bacterium]|jgi:nitroreductase|nr:nitroreductase family protein [Myxococcota bacterium]
MDFQELVARRRSVRAYRPDPVAQADLDRVLEAARLAPTAVNKQPFRLVLLPTATRADDLARIYHRPWFVQAPWVLGVLAVPDEAWVRKDGKNHAEIDAAIVMDHVVLAATDLGLGTCWVCNFDPDAAREVLALPPTIAPIAFTPLGHPADEPRPKVRKDLDALMLK